MSFVELIFVVISFVELIFVKNRHSSKTFFVEIAFRRNGFVEVSFVEVTFVKVYLPPKIVRNNIVHNLLTHGIQDTWNGNGPQFLLSLDREKLQTQNFTWLCRLYGKVNILSFSSLSSQIITGQRFKGLTSNSL